MTKLRRRMIGNCNCVITPFDGILSLNRLAQNWDKSNLFLTTFLLSVVNIL
jgi:hypothetical protein